ncbi:UPF0280 family protein [Roseibium algae]|uniref:UPF0280 family protein n=1 Tax=Roseibium algae TaxID=3123038 RepID=A0ABU8TNC2_9HYPH
MIDRRQTSFAVGTSGASGPTASLMPDGKRLHLQHGPIDLVIGASGTAKEVGLAFQQAHNAFEPVLSDLVAELGRLRSKDGPFPNGTVAQRMVQAISPLTADFITPMAAVAGSVADHILVQMIDGRTLTKAYVNNGGDIALYLNEGRFRIGICDDPVTGKPGGVVDISSEDGIGGIATSGWRGRSHSLGIADAVTVLASTAAAADAAATLIANKVDLPFSPQISREPAFCLSPDSDLGDHLVTTHVGPLGAAETQVALSRGAELAKSYCARGLITAAYLSLVGERRTIMAEKAHVKTLRNVAHA